ncbi:MAG: STAS domain-containing protein [SAR324 cluster bacterium]|nr:STAS domain-containing protein [SAR324 cluster bacterium]
MNLSNRIENETCVILIEEDLTWKNAEEFYFYVETLVEEHSLRTVVINLAKVKKIDSAGIGKMFSLYKRFQKKQIQLIICHVSDELFEMIKGIGLDGIFNFHSSEAKALASLHTE